MSVYPPISWRTVPSKKDLQSIALSGTLRYGIFMLPHDISSKFRDTRTENLPSTIIFSLEEL